MAAQTLGALKSEKEMINSILLENFQSHPSTELELHPGVNAIIGASDKGKSATIRALRWCAYNEPSGTAHISDWIKTKKGAIQAGERCAVTVRKGSDVVTRYRDSEGNGYTLGASSYTAIGADVPEQIKEALGLGEVNLQLQMDKPFLISESAGEVARFFNRAIKLEEIDKALTVAEAKKRESNASIRTLETQLSEAKAKLETYSWVERAEALLADVEVCQAKLAEETDREERLVNALKQLSEAQEHIQRASLVLEYADSVKEARELLSEVSHIAREINAYSELLRAYTTHDLRADRAGQVLQYAPRVKAAQKLAEELEELLQDKSLLTRTLEHLSQLESSLVQTEELCALAPTLDRALGIKEKLEVQVEQRNELFEVVNMLNRHERRIALSVEDLASLISQRPESCPLCGSTLKNKTGA